jgi:hypothetical protein
MMCDQCGKRMRAVPHVCSRPYATAVDDGYARTHDDAQALIRYAVPGAQVSFWRPLTASDRTRSYQITMRRWGRADVAVNGAYTIPAPAEALASNARAQCDKAISP